MSLWLIGSAGVWAGVWFHVSTSRHYCADSGSKLSLLGRLGLQMMSFSQDGNGHSEMICLYFSTVEGSGDASSIFFTVYGWFIQERSTWKSLWMGRAQEMTRLVTGWMLVHSNLSNKSYNVGGNIGGGSKTCGGQNHLFLKVRRTCVPRPPWLLRPWLQQLLQINISSYCSYFIQIQFGIRPLCKRHREFVTCDSVQEHLVSTKKS